MGFQEKLDSVIGAAFPSWQRARVTERWRTRVIEHGLGILGGNSMAERRYAGAATTDQYSTWRASGSSANTEIASSIGLLRNRSRQLVRDQGWPSVAVRRIVSNAIGDGMRATITHPDKALAERAQALWDQWAESSAADADGVLNLYGLQALALRSVIEGGDCLARARLRRAEDGLTVPLQIQLLEGDYLDTTRDTLGVGGRVVKQGIEFDALGRRTAYWLFRDHPGELGWRATWESVPVPAQFVAHAYRVERSGQVSGVPWGAPTFLSQRDLGDWKEATLVRLKAAACLVAIVTGGDPLDAPTPLTPGNATANKPETMNPGAVLYPDGAQSVTFSSPPGVQGTDNFSHQVLLEVSAAYGVPYEVMTGDLSRVNYSSIRAGLLEFQRELRIWRRDVLQVPLLDPIFRWFLEAAAFAGRLPRAPGFRVAWTPSRREFIDAPKEISGMVDEVRAGFSTWSEKVRENGWSVDELVTEYSEDLKRMDKIGVSFDTDPRRPKQGAQAAPQLAADSSADEKPAAAGSEKPAGSAA